MSAVRARHLSALVLVVFLLFGCGPSGPKRYRVSGTVQYKGQPIKAGVITFIPEGSKNSAGGAAIQEGKYELLETSGLTAGKYLVAISVPDAKNAAKEGEAPGVSTPQPKETLPAKYNSQTTLHAEVKAGAPNAFDFDLQ